MSNFHRENQLCNDFKLYLTRMKVLEIGRDWCGSVNETNPQKKCPQIPVYIDKSSSFSPAPGSFGAESKNKQNQLAAVAILPCAATCRCPKHPRFS